MSGYRLPSGGLINRRKPLGFTFDGKRFSGFEGDTVASALIASGERLIGRSFKYHRARGIASAGPEEPNGLITLRSGGKAEPNTRATMAELYDGLEATSQNRWPSLRWDAMAVNQLGGPLFAAGFYYKTFMGPTRKAWLLYEHFIRRAAGMGALSGEADTDRYDKHFAHCDVLVVGSGAAGLMAARTAADAGARVIIADEMASIGGALLTEGAEIDGEPAARWAANTLKYLADHDRVTLKSRTTIYGAYDDNQFGAVERVTDHLPGAPPGVPRQRHWTITAKFVVVASGALERPIVFPGNDRPGVMLAESVRTYIRRYGVAPGKRLALFATHDGAYRTARDAHDAGIDVVAIIDPRQTISAEARTIADAVTKQHLTGHGIVQTTGRHGISEAGAAPIDGDGNQTGITHDVFCDTLAISGGYTPTLHLTSQNGERPVWSDPIQAFVPPTLRTGWATAGAINGTFSLQACLREGQEAGSKAAQSLGLSAATAALSATDDLTSKTIDLVREIKPKRKSLWRGKAFVDVQHDVTSTDIALAHREGFTSVEHMKRYTTLGMAADQGKTSNVTGLALMANARGVDIPEVGTTRFRPPYTPVAIGTLMGREGREHVAPVRRTPMHEWHEKNDATFVPNGLWMRAETYLKDGDTVESASVREARTVRQGVGIVDVSTLGKIDVNGPDATEFINRVYSNGFAKLPVGKARYGLMLREDGILYDDGTTWRLAENRYMMTTTTGQAAGVMAHLEFLHATVWPNLNVALTSVTDQWAGIAVAGPQSRDLLAKVVTGIDLSNEGMPFMAVREGEIEGVPVRVARLSFSGELAYEVFCGWTYGPALWEHLLDAGKDLNVIPYGLEALGILRIEKGHVTHAEINGRQTAEDLGLGGMVSTKKDFVGSSMLDRQGLKRDNREQLVGLLSEDSIQIKSGSHLVVESRPVEPTKSHGWVTSNAFSPELDQYIALALLENGRERIGETLYATDPLRGRHVKVQVVSPHFVDPDGGRMHA